MMSLVGVHCTAETSGKDLVDQTWTEFSAFAEIHDAEKHPACKVMAIELQQLNMEFREAN